MNIKKIITVGLIAAASGAMALDYVEVTDVKARQRYPWNGLVDIDFELDSKATEPYFMKVTVFDNIGKTNLPVKTVCTEKVSQEANPCMVTKDTTRIVWNAAEDLPDGFKCTNVLVTCQDTRCSGFDGLYCIVDLKSGKTEYLDKIPLGGWSDEYKKGLMPFRLIPAGVFMMGSPIEESGRSQNETYHKVVITKPFYISVFELTEKQYSVLMGAVGDTCRAKLLSYAEARGADYSNYWNVTPTEYCWPSSKGVASSSVIGRFRKLTGKANADLPTEAQWEYACRAQSITPLNIGTDAVESMMNITGRYKGNSSDGRGDAAYVTHTHVGCYKPNAWGLFDMLGNAQEWVVDAYADDLGNKECRDPEGSANVKIVSTDGTSRCASLRVVKGGGYYQDCGTYVYDRDRRAGLFQCRAASRDGQWSGPDNYCRNGIRIQFTAE